jgi:hypothetical protein
MISNIFAVTGVGVAGKSRTLHAVAGFSGVAAHRVFAYPAASPAWPAAAIPMQRRRAATATPASVNRGST